ncbi:hypothetical protein HMPREF1860_00855 [Prevotella amnii]|uniref:DUF1064 domain-containing protein n=1 Tax=Prevotella amnii TaxID=419005 RepID=A0A134BFS2_9BACT|nr:DUF1064 domain-containing protein [Prevotella amnii]KXB78729.1 hypothetical protein HMPREF1860_00855 [Prevotella amnii]
MSLNKKMMQTKYFSNKIVTPFGKFDSKKEYYEFLRLKDMEKRGEISNLMLQPCFEIIPKLTKKVKVKLKTKVKYVDRVDEMAAHYTADFSYFLPNGQMVVCEVKSQGTILARDYPLRRKLVKQLFKKWNSEQGKEIYIFKEII